MFVGNFKVKFIVSAWCGIMLTSFASSETISKFVDKTIWAIPNGPLELSGICHVASNEYACVSDSGGRVYSLFINESQIESPSYSLGVDDFILTREGVGHDLEGCVYIDGAMLCVDESNSSIKVYYPDKKDIFSIKVPTPKVFSNCGLESLAYFSKDKLFVTCTEQATYGAQKGKINLIFFNLDLTSKKCCIKYEIPYQIDDFSGKNVYRNGVSELLAWDENTLLVVERAVDLYGRVPRSRIRIYMLDIECSDKCPINNMLDKQLVYEYDSNFVPINIEGICRIPNTNKLLVVHDLPGMCFVGYLEAEVGK